MLSPTPRTTTGAPPPSTPDRSGARLAALHFDPLPLYLAQREDPSLARTPLVCVEGERVMHANPVARRHGITPGMRLQGARMRVEGLQLAHYTEPDLQHAWNALLRRLHARTPWLEPGPRGRLLARLDPAEAEALAGRHGIRVGLADSRELAELAAAAARPGEARSVAPGGADAFLARLPLRFLKGVGLSDRNLTRLRWLGLTTAGELAAWTPSQLRSYLGKEGEALQGYLHGPRHHELRPFRPPEALRRSIAFDEPVREPYQWLPAIDRLAAELERALAGRVARRLTLTATLARGARRATRLSKRPLGRAPQIRQQALFALDDAGLGRADARGADLERLTLELAEPERLALQPGLWAQRERRHEAALRTLERYPGALVRFAWRDPYAQAADLAWAWEPVALEELDAAPRARRHAPRSDAPEAHPHALLQAAAVPLFAGPPDGADGDEPHTPTLHTPALHTPTLHTALPLAGAVPPAAVPAGATLATPGAASHATPGTTPGAAPGATPGDPLEGAPPAAPPDLLFFPLFPTPEDDHAPSDAPRPGHATRPPARRRELAPPHS